jgi:hypothetical protein
MGRAPPRSPPHRQLETGREILMKKEYLLREIAEAGYNTLYAAKKHFSTYDIVEKAPGWLRLATLGVGILTLALPNLRHQVVGVAVVLVGIASIYFGPFIDQRAKYAETGAKLINQFNRLRWLYNEVRSQSSDNPMEPWIEQYKTIAAETEQTWMHKHIFLSDWYAHYKIFWQSQIKWLDDELSFKLLRDKVPLSLTIAAIMLLLAFGVFAAIRFQ